MSNASPMKRVKRLGDSAVIVIVVESERYVAHECILSAASPVFKAMLTSGMRESTLKEIELPTIKKNNWQLISKFIYSETIDIEDEDSAVDIVHFAHQYEMYLLTALVENKLVEFTSESNAIERLLLADKLDLQILRKACADKIRRGLRTIRETNEFKNLPFRIINEILSDTNQARVLQIDIFEAINAWAHSSSSSTDDAHAEIVSGWKLSEARHLMRSLKGMGIDDITILAQHPASKLYPDLLADLLKEGAGKTAANGFNFLFKTKHDKLYARMWIDSSWHFDGTHKKWRLRLWRNESRLEAEVEPYPTKSDKIQIFRLHNGVERFKQDFTGNRYCSFQLLPEDTNEDLTFGVTIRKIRR